MGYQELVEHLRNNGEEKIRRLKDETEAEARKIAAETEVKIRELREEHEKKIDNIKKELEEKLVPKAEMEKRKIMLKAEKALSDRLFSLAGSCLCKLRDETYFKVFASLARELPTCKWLDVRVNPEDANIARQHFPESQIGSDQNISGGLKVQSEGGKILIDNTFEKRLERSWGDILSLLIHDIYREELTGETLSAI